MTAALASAIAGEPVGGGADANKYAQALGDGPLTKELSHSAQTRASLRA